MRLITASAIILAVGVFAMAVTTLITQKPNQEKSQTLETVPFSVFNDFDAAQIQQRLISLGMCTHADSREELEKYTSLVRAYDDGTYRACTFDDGNMVSIWANQSSLQLQSRVDASKIVNKVAVTGYNWFVDFDVSRSNFAVRIASQFNGKTTNYQEKISTRLDGKSASEILSQLVDDGYCIRVDPRSGFIEYPTLLGLFDENTLRGCITSKSGNYFFIYSNQSSSDIASELDSSSDTQNVYGKDWILEFVSTGNEAVITEIASQYNGTVQ